MSLTRPGRARCAGLRRRAAGLIVMAAALAGCGGGDRLPTDLSAARAYAGAVAQLTEGAREQLAGAAGTADYRSGASAAASTRAYAAAVRRAAGQLATMKVPATVATSHRALVLLYRGTAVRLEALAVQFGAAPDRSRLAEIAQQLATELQAYRGREQALRAAIDRGLASDAPATG